MSLHIPPTEYRARVERLRAHLEAEGLSGAVLFDSQYVLYYTGFAFFPTERPVAFVLNARGQSALFVPRLELEHAQSLALVDRVDPYAEYPDDPHPMERFKRTLQDLDIQGAFGADEDGYPWIFGYRGPRLSELTGGTFHRVTAAVEAQMAVKSAPEIALVRESVTWGNLAHTLLQRYTEVGRSESEVSARASSEATLAMMDAIGPVFRSQSKFFSGALALYRGQIGRTSAVPHALANNLTFQPGDVLVTGATAPVWGYISELERTMVMGPPSDEQKRCFDHMFALQDAAFAAMRPGDPCSEVDQAVRRYFEKNDLMPHWRHHTGHGLGLRYHEGPFLDVGDHTLMEPGMLFSVEPGLYVPELGGFRHSDTVLITEDGCERLTYYPRDLGSLTLPV